jgi:hypothetical protein
VAEAMIAFEQKIGLPTRLSEVPALTMGTLIGR